MKRNKHSLSHNRLLSLDMGILCPIGWFEVLPGDTIQHATSALIRAAPLVSPVMHPLNVRIHHFYVPNRLIWSEWEDFITGGPNGTSTPEHPYRSLVNGASLGTLADYFGIPTGAAALPATLKVSALPYRAYQMIWNEFYRDEDLETAAAISLGSGLDATANTLQKVSWEKDYYTSSRPWEQKGPAVSLPLGTSATVKTSATTNLVAGVQTPVHMTRGDGSVPTANLGTVFGAAGAGNSRAFDQGTTAGTNTGVGLYPSNLIADLSTATAATVNQLRQAMAIQRYEEARARYGSRYVEYLRYLGVRSSDARMQRPEYLGGGKQTVQFSEVLQTAPSASPDQANTVGALKGHGISAMRSNRYRRFIEEHGIVMSLMSIRPKTIYMNSLEKKWNRTVKEEYWQKELEHIGQQPIKNKEVYLYAASADATFGYQDRYDEYRRIESGVSGEFRTTLNYWHLARDFGSEPALNASFVSCVPTMRTFASSSTDPFYVMANHSIQARRMVARSGKSYIF